MSRWPQLTLTDRGSAVREHTGATEFELMLVTGSRAVIELAGRLKV
jgi:hypothetical protein